jgi:hypothetical protein
MNGNGWHDAEFAALGKIVVRFQQLDWCAEHMLKGFITPENVGILMCAGENTSWKLDKLAAVASEAVTVPEARTSLLTWVEASRSLVTRRNRLMHSFYMVEPGGILTHRWKASTRGGRWHGEMEQIGLADLVEVADLLAEGVEAAEHVMSVLAQSRRWTDYEP